jgi:MtfA peptidase
MFLDRFFRWRERRQLDESRIPDDLWARVSQDVLAHFYLQPRELARLQDIASLFLLRKSINGASDFKVDDYVRTVIAAQACLLVLELDLDYFNGWVEVIVYPDSFVVTREVRDEIGVVHTKRSVLGGEAWGRGPLILSWMDARPDTLNRSRHHGHGRNVILHEFAHKLDMLDGSADGTPPLHPDMHLRVWIDTFTEIYDDLRQRIEQRRSTDIDPYAAENPAEFFAVVSESFFETPERLHHYHEGLYKQLQLFYRQDPLQRLYDSRLTQT